MAIRPHSRVAGVQGCPWRPRSRGAGAQVAGALAREICPEVRTKGKLTAYSNDHELHYKGKKREKNRETKKKGRQMPFPCFFRASNLPLVNMFVKQRQEGAAEEGFGEADHRDVEYVLR